MKLLFLLLLVMLPAQLSGQHDIRISPAEPISHELPTDIQIQSVARSGAAGLAVWGTTGMANDSEVVSMLWMQLWRNGAPVGLPAVVNEPAGLPFDIVHVEPVDGGFIVLWNDRRSARSEIYMRAVDTTGVSGGEVLVAGGQLTRIDRYSSLSQMLIVHRRSLPPVIVYADGRIEIREIPSEYFTHSYVVDSDTSIAMIKGDTLIVSRSIFEEPYLRQRVEALAGCVEGSQGIRLVDSVGYEILAVFIHHDWTTSMFSAAYVAIPVSRHGDVDSSRSLLIDREFLSPPPAFHHITFSKSTAVQGCSNSFARSLEWSILTQVHTDQYRGSIRRQYSVDSRGGFDTGSSHLQMNCSELPQPSVHRILSDTISRIMVVDGSDTLTMSASTAPVRLTRGEINPRIWLHRDTLGLYWQQVWVELPFTVSRWEPDVSKTATVVQHFMAPNIAMPPGAYGGTTRTTRVFGFEQACVMAIDQWTQSSSVYGGQHALYIATGNGWQQALKHEEIEANNHIVFTTNDYKFDPVQQQIVGLVRMTAKGNYSRLIAVGLDPDGNEQWRIDSVELDVQGGRIIPIATRQLIIVDSTRAYRIDNGTVTGVFHFPDHHPDEQYIRLDGDCFLRSYYEDSARQQLRLEVFTLDGTFINAAEHFMGRHQDEPVITRRRSDGAIAVVYAQKGVHAVIFDRFLSSVVDDTLISATRRPVRSPFAVFRDESLIAVWEDYRNGAADIYGTVLPVTMIPASTHDRKDVMSASLTSAGAPKIISTLPNPAFTATAIEFIQSRPGATAIEIIDPVGRCAMTIELGSLDAGLHARAIDISALAPGIYTVVLRSGERFDRQRLVVIHR